MSGLAFSSMRVGEKYRLSNFGDQTDFVLVEVLNNQDYLLKDIFTLEQVRMSDLIQFGKGSDFELRELR